jgi:uncharacterized sulfatase
MFETPTTRAWKALFDAGKLAPAQARFWGTKPAEELYDLAADPDEVHNLAGAPEHSDALGRLRTELREHAARVRDVGFLPEDEIHARSGDGAPYDMGHDPRRYPFERVFDTALLASGNRQGAGAELAAALADPDSAVRAWGAIGLLARGVPAVEAHRAAIEKALRDPAPSVRIAAAEALGRFDGAAAPRAALDVLLDLASLERHPFPVALPALNAIDALDERARPILVELRALPRTRQGLDGRVADNVPKLLDKLLRDLDG